MREGSGEPLPPEGLEGAAEDPAALEELRRDARESLQPVGGLEECSADRIVGLRWRLKRVQRYETDFTGAKLDTAVEEWSALQAEAARQRELMEPAYEARQILADWPMPENTFPKTLKSCTSFVWPLIGRGAPSPAAVSTHTLAQSRKRL